MIDYGKENRLHEAFIDIINLTVDESKPTYVKQLKNGRHVMGLATNYKVIYQKMF